MRQSSDPAFREFLSLARVGAFTNEDLDFLNSKVISSLAAPELDDATIVAKRHILRHQVIRIRIEHFARNRGQKIGIFPALHTRTTSNDPSSRRLRVDELLDLQDDGSKIPFPGLFFYTQNMPVVMLSNTCTPLGQVNNGAVMARSRSWHSATTHRLLYRLRDYRTFVHSRFFSSSFLHA
jgi:hypothetical protein